jgi:hypothetical protein
MVHEPTGEGTLAVDFDAGDTQPPAVVYCDTCKSYMAGLYDDVPLYDSCRCVVYPRRPRHLQIPLANLDKNLDENKDLAAATQDNAGAVRQMTSACADDIAGPQSGRGIGASPGSRKRPRTQQTSAKPAFAFPALVFKRLKSSAGAIFELP